MYLDKLLKKQAEKYHKKRYINFRTEADKDKLKHNDFITKIQELLKDNYKQIPVTTLREKMLIKTFTAGLKNRIVTLAVYDGEKYYFYYSDLKDEKNVKRESPMKQFKEQFQQRTGKTLINVFGKTKQDFKVCVPQPLYYKSGLWPENTKIKNVCKEDFSSHYPSCAIKPLPDANTAKIINKYVRPDAEYEFAFYPESGHVAVYNEFDSHNYIDMQEIYGADPINRIYKTNYLKRETKTILMKAAKESLEELKTYYNIKNTYAKDTPEYLHAKLFMNMFLGMFEQNNYSAYERLPFAHLAAVIKWRANIKMFELIKEIGETEIIQICVDGLLHKGPAKGGNEKILGNLICEEENAVMIQKGINQYIVYGKEIHKCHAGYDINIESDNIEDWQISEKVNFLEYVKTLVEVEEI